jgi:hypothetical protein
MRTYNPYLPLVSLHIPKCAGTSFDYVLKKWFGKKLLRHYFNRQCGTLPKKHSLKHPLFFWLFNSDLCIHGHFNRARGFGIDDYYPNTQQFITILRDPFDQAVSLYFFVKGLKPQNSGIINESPAPASLEEYLINEESTIPLYFPMEMTTGNYVEFIEKHFVYIGVLENLQTSVNNLASRLKKVQVKIPHYNKNDKTIVIENEDFMRKLHRERNPFAYMLYDYARDHNLAN